MNHSNCPRPSLARVSPETCVIGAKLLISLRPRPFASVSPQLARVPHKLLISLRPSLASEVPPLKRGREARSLLPSPV